MQLSETDLKDLEEFANKHNKATTGRTYVIDVKQFCKEFELTPLQMVNAAKLTAARKRMETEMSMEASQQYEFIRLQIKRRVEKFAEQYIEKYEVKNGKYVEGENLAPKTLNRRLCAVKSYLLFKGVMDNPQQFKQIKFDKDSRVTRDKALIIFDQFKGMFNHADIKEKVVIGLYGNHGVRPSLIPQLLIEDLKSTTDAYTPLYVNGIPNRIQLEQYQWIMVKKEYEGNKGDIDFPIVLSGEVAEWMSQHLNTRKRRGEELTLKSKLVNVDNKRDVDYIVDKLFKAVGFDGRNYLLRHYGNKRLKASTDDKGFKEWMMGHKGDISDIYDHEHGLSHEEIKEYNANIDMSKLRIYGASAEELKRAKTMGDVVRKLTGADQEEINRILELLDKGTMTFEQFDDALTKVMREAQQRAIKTQFDTLMKDYQKRNNKAS